MAFNKKKNNKEDQDNDEVVEPVKKKKKSDSLAGGGSFSSLALDDFTNDLIKSLNKEFKTQIAYNLSTDQSPTHVKRWISSGSRQLDFIMSNRPNGGAPEGRIIEIFGPPSIGKSHIATQFAKSTQQMGGIVVYIDTENATSVENLAMLGVNVAKRFVYVDTHCTEEVFEVAESTILKASAMNKDVPITIIWDSVAASSPRAELEGDYDQSTMGLQARTISRSMRKITGVIANQNVLFICLNQIRSAIGVMYGDPTVVPGGKAIPFHSSIRIKLGAGSQLKDKDENVYGINVSAKTIKNKVAPPFRSCDFEIHFGKGIVEDSQIFDLLKKHGSEVIDGKSVLINGTSETGGGAWKHLLVTDEETGEVVYERKFYKHEFGKILKEEAKWIDPLFNLAMTRNLVVPEAIDIDENSYVEIQAISDAMSDSMEGLEE
jgi:recombination protein RecA